MTRPTFGTCEACGQTGPLVACEPCDWMVCRTCGDAHAVDCAVAYAVADGLTLQQVAMLTT